MTRNGVPLPAILLVLLSCGRAGVDDAETRVDTLASGRVWVSNPDMPSGSSPALRLFEELRIGKSGNDGVSDPSVFGVLVGVAEDDQGRIHVADRSSNEIRVFGLGGRFLRSFGRSGEAPGEFQDLVGVSWQPSQFVWAMDGDARQLTIFDTLGHPLAVVRHHHRTRSSMVPWAPKVVRPGFFYEEDWGSSPFARRILGSQISDDLSLAVTDTFHLPRREPRTRRRSTALGVQIVSVPTNDEPLWSAGSDGSMWLGNTSVFQLHKVTHDGDTVLTIEMRRAAERIDRAARDSLARALGFPARLIPSHKRVMGPYDVAQDGRIWVRQPDAVLLQAWEVFDAGGFHLGRAVSPVPLARIPVPSFGHGTITGVTEDALGIQYVVRLRVQE